MKNMSVYIFGILYYLEEAYSTDVCSSDTLPVVRMCTGGAALGQSVLMDFSDADLYAFTTCSCTVEVNKGNILSMEEVFAPRYIQCGSSITIRDNKNDIRHIINCYGRADINYLQQDDVLSIMLTRHFTDANAKYCYQLNITGGKSASIQVKCNQHTTSTTTTTTTTTTPQPEVTGFNSSAVRDIKQYTLNECSQTTLFVIGSVLALSLVFNVAATIFIIRRRKPKPVKTNNKEEIYEEIAPSNSVPVYNPSVTSRPLPPNPSFCNGNSFRENDTKSRGIPVNSQWNNTYDRIEDKVGGITYVNQRF